MGCGNLWKRIVPFLLTFLLALFISKLFLLLTMPLELIERDVSPPLLENSLVQTERQTSLKLEKKIKCVPADSSLKYRQISDTYIVEPAKVDEESEEIAEGINEELEKEIEKLEKELEELRKSNYFAETTNLLHIEKCYEIK